MTWVVSIALNNKNGKKKLRILKLRKIQIFLCFGCDLCEN